jgi:hypothetical protein
VSTPVPHRPPKPSPTEVATAKAELEIVLFPKEVHTKARSEISVSADQSRRLIETMSWLGHLALAVILVIGTLFAASSAHLNPVFTTTIVLVELMTVLGVALFRRQSRRR